MHDRLPPPDPGRCVLSIRPMYSRRGLVLTGEADLTVSDTLRTALSALQADGTGDIHLDLSGLSFIDVSCTRELIAITDRDPAVRLIVHDPPASLLRIIGLLCPQARIEFTETRIPAAGHRNAATRGDGRDSRREGSFIAGREQPSGMSLTDVTEPGSPRVTGTGIPGHPHQLIAGRWAARTPIGKRRQGIVRLVSQQRGSPRSLPLGVVRHF